MAPGEIIGLPGWCPECGIHLSYGGPCVVCKDKASKERESKLSNLWRGRA